MSLPPLRQAGGNLEPVLAALVAAGISAALSPGVRAAAVRLGALDLPQLGRKLHQAAVPRPGGVAVVVAFNLVAIAALTSGWVSAPVGLAGLLWAAGLVAALGLYDDLRWAGAPLKLSVQAIAALLAIRAGWRFDALAIPGAGEVSLGALAAPVSVLWLLTTTNAINLVDGLDGLAARLSLIATTGIAGVAVIAGNPALAVLAATLAGAIAGFLPWNSHPARLFLGDSGALTLGFLLGALSLRLVAAAGPGVPVVVPLILLAVPLADTIFAFVRRAIAGRNPFKGDLGHLHHRLLASGMPQAKVVNALSLVALLLAIGSVVAAMADRM